MMKSVVDEKYYAHLDSLSPAERFRMVSEMTEFLLNSLRHQVSQDHPAYNSEQVKIAAAQRFYYDDPQVLKMLGVLMEKASG
jgi:hypothetical protein